MRTIRNIVLIFVVSMLILSTGGISVYRHICYCAGEVSASVFLEATCYDEHNTTSCCSAEETHSCCADEPVRPSRNACHDDDCCQNSVQFLKISDSFQPGLEKISLKPLLVFSAVLFFDITEDIYFAPNLNICNSDLPPPETGKQILTSHHQLKLDTPLA